MALCSCTGTDSEDWPEELGCSVSHRNCRKALRSLELELGWVLSLEQTVLRAQYEGFVGCRKGDKDNAQRKARDGGDMKTFSLFLCFSLISVLLSSNSLPTKASLSVQCSGMLLLTQMEQQ